MNKYRMPETDEKLHEASPHPSTEEWAGASETLCRY